MNILISGIIIFFTFLLILKLLAKISKSKISTGMRVFIFIILTLIALLFAFGGRFLLSLPLVLLSFAIVKLKGLTIFQIFQLWRLINFLRNSGRFSKNNFNKGYENSDLSLDEAYKILNLKKSASKEEVNLATKKLQKKLHPDISPETARLSALVNEAKDIILKNIV
ncbi:MAG: molecular chaperone DnaJ [Candidatus Pelagibacter sp. TMED64]|nr:molecular chaperone DnaJ [Candidatus Pelagibacter sp.]OUU65004.1 MAG: molecular chaperone DnaJ [Candidatus Pelagibacter sp. TMED64]|tara:strand:- start:18645 stop:19145 length:501 start_codon:yes stop_codon:yes gene_type:complete